MTKKERSIMLDLLELFEKDSEGEPNIRWFSNEEIDRRVAKAKLATKIKVKKETTP